MYLFTVSLKKFSKFARGEVAHIRPIRYRGLSQALFSCIVLRMFYAPQIYAPEGFVKTSFKKDGQAFLMSNVAHGSFPEQWGLIKVERRTQTSFMISTLEIVEMITNSLIARTLYPYMGTVSYL